MAISRKDASSPTTDTFERDRQQARELTQQRVRDYAQNFGAAGNLYGLLQPRLPPVGLFAPPRPSVHPPLHPNRDNSKRKRVHFVDLTSDADDTSAELQPHPVKRPRPSPPKSAPQPRRKTKKQPIGAHDKKAQNEQEAQLTADERLARELQEAELRNGKSQRLRNKTRSAEKRLDKKLSVYEEFQRIEEEAVQREQRQRSLRIASPEKRSLRTLRSSSPEKQPGKKLPTYEEFQKIQQEAAQGKHSSKKLRKSQQAAQSKHPSKKLSV
ncbi:hypothetical protein SLS60_008608 [Paraconiothyrium brasiliense]|uniref:Uncharacterized protein n=1 Tax=Paraconiothyrium brasiliense TaxID=300254 RepID=A0ABR3QXX9_9PLEO